MIKSKLEVPREKTHRLVSSLLRILATASLDKLGSTRNPPGMFTTSKPSGMVFRLWSAKIMGQARAVWN